MKKLEFRLWASDDASAQCDHPKDSDLMAKLSSQPLRPNPFHTYRDPETGKWLVVESDPADAHDCFHVDLRNMKANLIRKQFARIGFKARPPEFSLKATIDS